MSTSTELTVQQRAAVALKSDKARAELDRLEAEKRKQMEEQSALDLALIEKREKIIAIVEDVDSEETLNEILAAAIYLVNHDINKDEAA